jgi:NDP-sugar pyrophosphorylase family protein/aminoglycoside/choline kinase family phosphotransferase
MNPLSRCLPKCLVPVWGRPVIDHLLDQLTEWGVQDVLINLHHGASSVFQHLHARADAWPRINFSYEPQILGTGGVLKRASWFIDDAPFWMMNADILMDASPAPLIRQFTSKSPLAALWMTDRDGPRTVDMHHHTITSLRSQQPRTPGTYTFCGLQLISPELLSYLPPQSFSSVVEAYEAGIQRGARVLGTCIPQSYWADIGTPESYLAAHADTLTAYRNKAPGGRYVNPRAITRMRQLRKQKVSIRGFASIAETVRVSPGARLENVVVLENGTCGRMTHADNAIVAAPLPPKRTVRRLLVPADSCGDENVLRALQQLQWPAEDVSLECLALRGSQRTFTRLYFDTRSAMLVVYDPSRQENCLHAPLTRFLKRNGWPVPDLIHDFRRHDMMLLEDAGDDTLEQVVRRHSRRQTETCYETILEDLVKLQGPITKAAKRARTRFSPGFEPELYRADLQHFQKLYLETRLGWKASKLSSALREVSLLSKTLRGEPQVLVHRDFQSSNILIHGGSPFYIDFQGLRYGPHSYDLASLLYDPYVQLSSASRRRLIHKYALLTGSELNTLTAAVLTSAVHRLIQALGAFARLSSNPETEGFKRYILPALQNLQFVLRKLDKLPKFLKLVNHAIEQEQSLAHEA